MVLLKRSVFLTTMSKPLLKAAGVSSVRQLFRQMGSSQIAWALESVWAQIPPLSPTQFLTYSV